MTFRRIISLFLVLLMTLSTFAGVIPTNAFASEITETAETEESTSKVVASYKIPMEDVTFAEDGSMYIDLSDFEPEATEPEATEPEATEPEATEPEATEPEATEPEATEPETTEPEATEPEATEPEATEPEATEPEATEPEATEPEATEPEATEPEATEPEATEPEATEPEVTEPEATEPEVTEPEATEPEVVEPLTWFQWIEEKDIDVSALTKEEYAALLEEYSAYRINFLAELGESAEGATAGTIANNYIEVAVSQNGEFTIGNRLGNPNYSSDDYKILLFGHPSPGTSNTLITIDGGYSTLFRADSTSYSYNTATSIMNISTYGIKVVQTLKLIKVGSSSFEDTVQIQYQVYNNGNKNRDVGIRIMMDTMLADNDDATYRLTSLGHVTTARVFTGSAIPSTYQFYDNIQNPTTMATGYLYRGDDRKPDKVQFCNWGGIVSSSWNHVVKNGDYLGDSAVGIYFNPVTVKPGKNTAVRTYYGVSLGSATGDSNEVTSGQVKLTVKDSATQVPLGGVSVAYRMGLNGTTYNTTTDSNGVAFLTGFPGVLETMVSTSITLTKTGYKTSSFVTQLRGGANISQQMSKEDAPKPVINTITLNTGKSSVNLLTGSYTFDEDPNDFIGKNGATGTVTIKATADIANCTWQFVQDEKVLRNSANGEFVFNVRETTVDDEKKVLIEDLSPGGNCYIQCISPDGKRSDKMRIGLNIITGEKVEFFDFDMGKVWPGMDGKLGEGTLGALFLGNKLKLGPEGGKYEVYAELTEDGVIRVGINYDVKNLGKINEIENGKPVYKQRKEDFLKIVREEMHDFSTGKNKKMKSTVAKPGKFSYGLGKADFVFCGYGEGQYENGTARVDVTMLFAVKAKGSYTWQFIWGTVPVYVDVGGEAGAKLEATANIWNTEGLGFRFYDATFNLSAKFWLEGGVGVKKVVSIGIQGSATGNYYWDLVDQSRRATLTGSASLVAEAFGIFEKDLTFAKKTVPLFDSNDKEGTVYGGDENMFEKLEEQPYRLITREEENAEGGTSQYATNARIITVDGVTYKFFATDRGGNLSNRYMLCWSKLENGAWTEAVPVADDGTSDLYYDVAVNGSEICVVWSNSGKTFDDATVTLDEFAAAQEICLAVIDTVDGTVNTMQLTDNAVMDTMPAVTILDGTSYVVWSNTENSIESLSDVYDNYLHYTAVTGNTAGETVVVNFQNASINTISASATSGKPLATVVSNATDEYSMEENVTTVIDMSSGTKTDVDTTDKVIGKAVTGTINGIEQTFWMENGNVLYADSITSENPSCIFSEDALPGTITADNYTVISAGNNTYLIWSQSSGEEGVPAAAMTTVYSNGTWSSVHKLTDLTTGDITKLDGYLNAEGQLVLVYTVKNISENSNGQVNISTASYEKVVQTEKSLSIASLDFEITDAIPGQILPMKLDVVNTGNSTIDALDLAIDSEAGENYTATLTGLNIGPGTSQVIEINDFRLSSTLTTRTVSEGQYIYTLTANASDSELTATEIFEIGYDKVVIYKRDTAYVDNQKNMVIAVENMSGFPATNVRIQILADATDGVLIYDKTFDEILANDMMTIYLPVEEQDSTRLYAFVSSDSTEGEESECFELIVSNPSTMASLSMEVVGNGTVTPAGETMFEIGGPVDICAVPNEGYLFDGWYSNRELEFQSGDQDAAAAQILMPANDTVVTARFVSEEAYDFALSAESASIYAGEQYQLTANFASLEETGKVTWFSDNEAVASVSSRGVITGLSAGTAQITAACGAYVHTAQITVSYVDVTSIRMIYPTLVLPLNETAVAEVLTDPENGIASLLWSSSDESIATVDQQGNVTAVSYGSATITATARTNDTVTAECTVEVVLPVEEILLDQNDLNLTLLDNKAELNVIYEPAEATYGKRVIWSAEDPGIVELEASGEFNEKLSVTAIGCGSTTITAKTEEGIEASCFIDVRDIVYVSSLEELQSNHPYEADIERTWIYTDETKDFLILHFNEDSQIGDNDSLQIMDADENIVLDGYYGTMSGMKVLVPGSTVKIRLTSDGDSDGSYGFCVDEISDTILEEDINIYFYDMDYTGKALTPRFEVYFGPQYLVAGKDYSLSYANNKNVGTASVTFTGKGYYEGISRTEYFNILPAYPSMTASVGTKGITLNWTASKGAGGYLLYRNTDDQYNDGEYWTLLKKLSGSSKSYVDGNTDNEHAYSYMLVAYKDVTKNKQTIRYEANAAHVGPITRLGPVKKLTCETDAVNDLAILNWEALEDADGYIVYHAVDNDEFYRANVTTGTECTVSIRGIGKHWFKIVPYRFIDGKQQQGVESKSVATYKLASPHLNVFSSSKSVELDYEYIYVQDMKGIQIERSTDNGKTWTAHKTVKTGSGYYPGEYIHGTLNDTSGKTSGTTYRYRARTYLTAGKTTYYSTWRESETIMFLSQPSISTIKTGENGGLEISWKKVAGAQWYRIGRRDHNSMHLDENVSFIYYVDDLTEETYTFLDESITEAGRYEYYVQAWADNPDYEDDHENYYSACSAYKAAFVLDSPVVTHLSNAAKGIILEWNTGEAFEQQNNFAQGFEIWRSLNYNEETGEGTWSKIKTLKNVGYLNDTSASGNGKVYSYKVRGYSKQNGITYYSDFSNIVSLCKMAPPKLKKVSSLEEGGFQISFNYVKDATRYEILRHDNFGETSYPVAVIEPTNAKTTSYTVTDTTAQETDILYTYEIRALREQNGVLSEASCYAYTYNYSEPEVNVESSEKGMMIRAARPDASSPNYSYASSYTIYRSVNGESYTQFKTVKSDMYGRLIYKDTSVKVGNTYSYQVIASGKNYVDAFTAKKSEATTPVLCKTGPKMVSVENAQHGITVTWKSQKGMPAAEGYAIYRSQDDFTYTLIDTVGNDVFSYTDATAHANGYYIGDDMYYYKVAVIENGQSTAYTSAQKILRMTAPYEVEAWNRDAKTAEVSWRNDSHCEGYEIRYKTGNTTKIVKNKYVLTGLKTQTFYEISVRCYMKFDGKTYYSAWSDPYILER